MAQPRSWPTEQLERFERILSKRTGLSFDDRNRGTLAVALGDFLDAHPSMTVEETLARLMDESDEVTLRHLVSSLTVRETYFFRNPAHFEILEQRVLPGIVERNSLARRPSSSDARKSEGTSLRWMPSSPLPVGASMSAPFSSQRGLFIPPSSSRSAAGSDGDTKIIPFPNRQIAAGTWWPSSVPG